MKKVANVAGIVGINGCGADFFENAMFENANDNNEYAQYGGLFSGGLEITENIKNQLESQPNSKFLYFEKTSDGKYIINPKLPEKGAVTIPKYDYKVDENGKIESFKVDGTKRVEFNIRKNINYFYKAIAKSFINENDEIDIQKGLKVFEELSEAVGIDYHSAKDVEKETSVMERRDIIDYDKGTDKIADFVINNINMSEEDKKDFKNFCSAGVFRSGLAINIEQPEMINGRFFDDCFAFLRNTIMPALNIKNIEKFSDSEYDEIKRNQNESFEKFEKDIRDLSKIDPINEKKFINMFQSSYVGSFFKAANELSNNILDEKTPDILDASIETGVSNEFENSESDPKKAIVRTYVSHSVMALNFKIDGKDCLIAIDADARSVYEQVMNFNANNQTFIGLYQVGQEEPRKFNEAKFESDFEDFGNKILRNMRRKYEFNEEELAKIEKLVESEVEKESQKENEIKFEIPKSKIDNIRTNIQWKARENLELGKELNKEYFDRKLEEEKRIFRESKENQYKKEAVLKNITDYFKNAPKRIVPEKSKELADSIVDLNLGEPKENVSYKLGVTEIKNSELQRKSGLDVLDSFFGYKGKDIDEYVKNLNKLYINGAKATTVFDIENMAEGDDIEAKVYVAATRLKEMYDNNLDSSHFTKMHFAMEGVDGKLRAVRTVGEAEEVKEVQKPSTGYKMFHSKANYDEKMQEWEKYQSYKKYSDNLNRINDETAKFYEEINKIREEEKNDNIRKINFNDLKSKNMKNDLNKTAKTDIFDKVTKAVTKEQQKDVLKKEPLKK